MTTKEKIIHVVEDLPEDATVEEAIERQLFLAKLERGLAQADAGAINMRGMGHLFGQFDLFADPA